MDDGINARRTLVSVQAPPQAPNGEVRHMRNATNEVVPGPGSNPKDPLTEILREGAQQMLGEAIREEVAAYIQEHAEQRDEDGHRLVVRNGVTVR